MIDTLEALLRARARDHGDASFLETQDERFSFAQAARLAHRYAHALAGLGVRREGRIALLLDNSPTMVWTVFGLGLLGATAVPLNTAAKGPQLRHLLADSDPAIVIAEERFAAGASVANRRVVRRSELDAAAFASGLGGLVPEGGPIRGDELLLLMYTSGTTGPSKGVMCPQSHPLAVARYVAQAFAIDDADRMYCCLPLFHATALWWDLLAGLWAGATVVLRERFSASRFWSDLASVRATRFSAMMGMTSILMSLPPAVVDRAHSAHTSWVAPLPFPLEAWEDRFGVRACTDYAMTELHPIAVLSPDGPRPTRLGFAGHVCDHDEVRIVGPQDVAREPGEVGEILVRPRERGTSFAGYWRHPPPADDWFRTGDLGVLADDCLFFAGRTKDALRRHGENISAWEVEQALLLHPNVREAAVFGIPSTLGEHDVACFVVCDGGPVGEEDLFRFAAENMAYFMVPRYLRIVDSLPRNHAFKVAKDELQQIALDAPGMLWDSTAAGLAVGRDGVREIRTTRDDG